jgi:hypothetical protein
MKAYTAAAIAALLFAGPMLHADPVAIAQSAAPSGSQYVVGVSGMT